MQCALCSVQCAVCGVPVCGVQCALCATVVVPGTHVHKLPMYLFFYMALRLNDFVAGNMHYKDHLMGWALNS